MTTPVIKIAQPPAVVVRTIPAGTTLISGGAFIGDVLNDIAALEGRADETDTEQATQDAALTTLDSRADAFDIEQDAQDTAIATAQTTATAAQTAANARILRAGDTMTGPLGVLKPTAVGQPPQLNAYDPVTGRRLVDGREEGNTGWRGMSSILTNGWEIFSGAYTPLIRRVGYTVETVGLIKSGASTTLTGFAPLSVGFRPPITIFDDVRAGDATQVQFEVRPDVNEFRVAGIGKSWVSIHMVWTTTEAWPTSLPGTQITAPYSLPI